MLPLCTMLHSKISFTTSFVDWRTLEYRPKQVFLITHLGLGISDMVYIREALHRIGRRKNILTALLYVTNNLLSLPTLWRTHKEQQYMLLQKDLKRKHLT
jgi:hypothetical protein